MLQETKGSLCGQILDSRHRLLRTIVSRDCLPEDDWDALLEFDFTNAQLLSMSQFMEKTEFRTKAMRAARRRIHSEREKNKKVRTDVVARTVMGECLAHTLIKGRPIFGMCGRNSSIIQPSSPIWSWVWRAMITPFCLPCQKIKLQGVIRVFSIVFLFVDGCQRN